MQCYFIIAGRRKRKVKNIKKNFENCGGKRLWVCKYFGQTNGNDQIIELVNFKVSTCEGDTVPVI